MVKRQKVELLKAEQSRRECEKDPALRRKIEMEAQQGLEAHRDHALGEMEKHELSRINGIDSIPRQIAAHKLFWAWRKQARSELQQLRETERSSREHLAQTTDASLFAKANVALDPDNEGKSYIFITSGYPVRINDTLPITTLATFALEHQQTPEHPTWFKSGAAENSSSTQWPPGKRFSPCEIPHIPCKPEHHRWLKKSAGLSLVKESSCDDDRTPQKRLRPWASVARSMWMDNVAASQSVKNR